MITCRESARMLSEQRDRPLPWRRRLALRFHLALCRLCRVYAAQLRAVGRVSRLAGIAAPERCPGVLPAERKERMKDALSKEPS